MPQIHIDGLLLAHCSRSLSPTVEPKVPVIPSQTSAASFYDTKLGVTTSNSASVVFGGLESVSSVRHGYNDDNLLG